MSDAEVCRGALFDYHLQFRGIIQPSSSIYIVLNEIVLQQACLMPGPQKVPDSDDIAKQTDLSTVLVSISTSGI